MLFYDALDLGGGGFRSERPRNKYIVIRGKKLRFFVKQHPVCRLNNAPRTVSFNGAAYLFRSRNAKPRRTGAVFYPIRNEQRMRLEFSLKISALEFLIQFDGDDFFQWHIPALHFKNKDHYP